MSTKVHNAIIIGPSSSGKTTIASYLAEKYKGRCISLDGFTSSGRPINSFLSLSNTRKFTKEDLGVLIRKMMLKEIKNSLADEVSWFVDDIDSYILSILPTKVRAETKIICVIPTIDKIIKNVIARNKEAKIASEERRVASVLKQFKNFIELKHCAAKCGYDDIKKYGNLIVTNKDIIEACEYDKIFYSISEKGQWEEDTNNILHRFGFKSLRHKKTSYAIITPINFGQNITYLNDGKINNIINKVDKYISTTGDFEHIKTKSGSIRSKSR